MPGVIPIKNGQRYAKAAREIPVASRHNELRTGKELVMTAP